ncbi:MAG: hypothetical protein GY795_24045, partial [Desulfobacterales bacterium]|nr:hypothetical protein [Desulfobacterales bacterium]
MYKVDDIYNRLNSGAAGAKRSGAFAGPVSGPGSASRTLDEVMGIAPAADDTDGAATGNVLSGKTFWGLTSGQWGPQTGAMPNNGAFALSCGTGDQGVTAGYYSGGTLTGDGDLVSTNIKSSVNIFGVTGTVIESSGDAVAGDVLTGKTFSNAGAAGVSGTMANIGAFA